MLRDLGCWFVLLCLSLLSWQEPALAADYRVGTWKTAQTIQPFFYQESLAQGNTARVFAFTNPADQKTALLAGSLDMTGTTLAHAIRSAVMGQPVVVVAALCNKCSALVVKEDGDIQAINDLKGKKIGYVPGTMHEILLREALTRNGLSPQNDVQLVRVDFFDMGTALAKGSIDAFLSGEPFPTMAVAKGYGRILAYPYFGESVGTINAGMLVKRNLIEENPQAVQELVMAHSRATIRLNQDRETWLARAATFGTPRGLLDQAVENMELAWFMDEHYIQQAKALGARMQALGVIDHQPDYAQLFDLRFVRQAQQELGQ
nr:NrtA/SsuA/CpmA family ABC transporter substrate-binding protein [uncultured Desulfobulbus sp.]